MKATDENTGSRLPRILLQHGRQRQHTVSHGLGSAARYCPVEVVVLLELGGCADLNEHVAGAIALDAFISGWRNAMSVETNDADRDCVESLHRAIDGGAVCTDPLPGGPVRRLVELGRALFRRPSRQLGRLQTRSDDTSARLRARLRDIPFTCQISSCPRCPIEEMAEDRRRPNADVRASVRSILGEVLQRGEGRTSLQDLDEEDKPVFRFDQGPRSRRR